MGLRSGWLRISLVCLLTQLVQPLALWSDCPEPQDEEILLATSLESASRTQLLGIPVPRSLYRRALDRPGVAALRREGKLAQAVVVVDLPVERMWMAINDDGHHADGGYLPLETSLVLDGEPARSGRKTLQAFAHLGIGRWWVNQMEMSPELYRLSNDRLWELRWHDVMADYPDAEPPVAIGASVGRLEASRGAWLLLRLGDECTLAEYVAQGEPGGFLGMFQWMVATRALRSTIEGMVELARRHIGGEHVGTSFVRPDGSRLEPSDSGLATGK